MDRLEREVGERRGSRVYRCRMKAVMSVRELFEATESVVCPVVIRAGGLAL